MVMKDSHEQPEKQQFPMEETSFEIVIKDNDENMKNNNFKLK
jgi:hypothetical protein